MEMEKDHVSSQETLCLDYGEGSVHEWRLGGKGHSFVRKKPKKKHNRDSLLVEVIDTSDFGVEGLSVLRNL